MQQSKNDRYEALGLHYFLISRGPNLPKLSRNLLIHVGKKLSDPRTFLSSKNILSGHNLYRQKKGLKSSSQQFGQ